MKDILVSELSSLKSYYVDLKTKNFRFVFYIISFLIGLSLFFLIWFTLKDEAGNLLRIDTKLIIVVPATLPFYLLPILHLLFENPNKRYYVSNLDNKYILDITKKNKFMIITDDIVLKCKNGKTKKKKIYNGIRNFDFIITSIPDEVCYKKRGDKEIFFPLSEKKNPKDIIVIIFRELFNYTIGIVIFVIALLVSAILSGLLKADFLIATFPVLKNKKRVFYKYFLEKGEIHKISFVDTSLKVFSSRSSFIFHKTNDTITNYKGIDILSFIKN
ncbi:MAG: hypothetical protein LBV58_04445 [Acholeplasmatales bacterium]|nr:hypothetical protein [Acholeplasmatales bacterium]